MSFEVNDTSAQQSEVRSSVHLPCEHLDAVYLAFDRSGVVHEGQVGGYGIEISSKSGYEGPQCPRPDRRDCGHLLGEIMSPTLDHDPGESASMFTHGRQGRTAVADVGEPSTVFSGEIVRVAGQPYGHLPDARGLRPTRSGTHVGAQELQESADGLRASPVTLLSNLPDQESSIGASAGATFSQVGLIAAEKRGAAIRAVDHHSSTPGDG